MKLYKREWMQSKGHYVGLFVLLAFLFVGTVAFFDYRNLQSFIANEEKEVESDFSRHGKALQEISDLIYETIINTEQVVSVFKGAHNETGQQRDRIRNELLEMLENDYRMLHKFRIQQLHFQLPDNESFLRFHKPKKYGDNLSGIRPTIEYVNRTHKPISGFEEGRIFNGFRFAYPLFDEMNNYIGSVEISSSALSYKEAYELDQKQELDIVMRSDVVEKKVFESEHRNYLSYKLNPNFSIERSMEMYDRQKRNYHQHVMFLEYFGRQKEVTQRMNSMEKFSVYGIDRGTYVMATFLPLSNIVTGEKVAYAIIFRESEYLKNAFRGFIIQTLLAVLAAFVLTLIYYFVQLRFAAQRALEEALIKAEDASRAKDAFLSTMSHELRTPLNAIIGFSQILMSKPDVPDTVKKMVEKIHISGKNLLTLVNSILDFSKIGSGKMDVVKESFEIQNMLEEVKVLIEPMAEKNRIALEFNLGESVSVYADRQLIKQVVVNLLTNAIKFSPPETTTTLTYECRNDMDLFTICDEGVGIPREKLETLFDPFTQIREHQNDAIKGTGLGLAIAKKIIELHDGKLWVESTTGEGSCFSFTLPLEGKVEEIGQPVIDAVKTVD